LTVLTGLDLEQEFVPSPLSAGYRGRIPDVVTFARRNRVVLVESAKGVPIDIALAGLPFEALMIDRSSLFEYEPGCTLRTCSAEDLVLLKLFAFRAQDLTDVETVVIRQSNSLDWDYVEEHLAPLAELKEQLEIMQQVAKLRRV
jgi:hypothetical protein